MSKPQKCTIWKRPKVKKKHINRHFSHMTKSRIFKNLSLKRKVDRNFCGILLENHFRYLKLYSISPIKKELNPWKKLFLLNLNFGLSHKSKIWPILYGDMFMSRKFSLWKLRASDLRISSFPGLLVSVSKLLWNLL